MDIRRLGPRSLANLAYAYLLTGWIEKQVAEAEQRAVKRKHELTSDERSEIVEQAVRDFNTDIEAPLRLPVGVDRERLARARSNARAISGLMQDIDLANTAASS